MAFSKSNRYPKEDQLVSGSTKPLGHSARVAIFRRLAKEGRCSVEQLSKGHPITQPSLAEHLRILRNAQWVWYTEEYPYTYYELDKKNVIAALANLDEFIQEILNNLDE